MFTLHEIAAYSNAPKSIWQFLRSKQLIATDGSPCHQCDGHVYIYTSNSHPDQQIIKCDTCQKRTSIFVDSIFHHSRLELFVICQNTRIIRRFDDEGSTIDQGVIFGMVGRTSGVIELAIIPDNKAATMRPIIDAHDGRIITDNHASYGTLWQQYHYNICYKYKIDTHSYPSSYPVNDDRFPDTSHF
jgi:hypothetical protein